MFLRHLASLRSFLYETTDTLAAIDNNKNKDKNLFAEYWTERRLLFHRLFMTRFTIKYKDGNRDNCTDKNIEMSFVSYAEAASIVSWKDELIFPTLGLEFFQLLLDYLSGKSQFEINKNSSKYDVILFKWIELNLFYKLIQTTI